MADVELEFRGLNELTHDFEMVVKHYPDETVNALMRAGKAFIQDTTDAMPGYYSTGKQALNNPKNWKREKETLFTGQTAAVTITCKSPHWHLVENGHAMWVHGKDTGQYVPGKHYVEKQSKIYRNKLPAMMSEYVDKMLKEHDL